MSVNTKTSYGVGSLPDWDEALEEVKRFNKIRKRILNVDPPELIDGEEAEREFFMSIKFDDRSNPPMQKIIKSLAGRDPDFVILPTDPGQSLGKRIRFIYHSESDRKDLQDASSDVREAAVELHSLITKPPSDRTSLDLQKAPSYFENLQEAVSTYTNVLQPYVDEVAPGPDSFQWEGFRIENSDGLPDRIVEDMLDGIKEGLSVFEKRGLNELLYETLTKIILKKDLEGVRSDSASGVYLGHQEIMKLDSSTAKPGRSGKIIERWITEVFIHELGHHVHLSFLPREAKEFWDSGWKKVHEAEERLEEDLEITDQDRKKYFEVFKENGYDFQKAGRSLDGVDRIKYLSLLHPTYFTVPTQARLTDKAKEIQQYLQEDPGQWAKYLEQGPPRKTRDQTVWEIAQLGTLFGVQEEKSSPAKKEVEPSWLLEEYEEGEGGEAIEEAKEALDIPTEYGKENVKEDFAETFVLFVKAPWELSDIAKWRMGRTLGMSKALNKPVMKLTTKQIKIAHQLLKRAMSRRIARRCMTSGDVPKTVERYVKEHKEQGYDKDKAWAVAWSRYCSDRPDSPHCKQDEYFPNRPEVQEGIQNDDDED